MDLNVGSSPQPSGPEGTPPPQPQAEGAAQPPQAAQASASPGVQQQPASGPPAAPQQSSYTPPPPPPEAPRRRMSGCLIALLVGLGLVIVGGTIAVLVVSMMAATDSTPTFSVGGDRIGLINISGIIQTGGEGASWFGPGAPGSRAIMEQVREAAKDKTVKAVILRINSPGGSAAASQEIFKEVLKLRDEAKKPVIVSMADVAASGGYYIASAATTIVANPSTMTGSIGVITQSINWTGLANKYGVEDETFTSGPYKDTMNPFRHMREDERQLMREMIKEVYGQFVKDVARARKMDEKELRKLADGRVYLGSQAKKLKLIDEIGNFHDAVKIAAKAAGIEGEPKLKEFGRVHGLYGWLNELTRSRGHNWPGSFFAPYAGLGPGMWMIMEGNQTVVAK